MHARFFQRPSDLPERSESSGRGNFCKKEALNDAQLRDANDANLANGLLPIKERLLAMTFSWLSLTQGPIRNSLGPGKRHL